MSGALATGLARAPRRRLAAVIAAWLALLGSALAVATTLDSPVGAGARDEAQPAPAAQVDDAAPETGALPPFAMVLDHALPPGVRGLAPARQAVELRVRAMRTRSPERLVELGSVLQVLGDTTSARFSYESALRYAPGDLDARIGLAMIDGGEGAEGLRRSAARLAAIAADAPGSQAVSFNRAWVDVYRGDGDAARRGLERTAAMGPDSRLGRTATALIAALDQFEIIPDP